ncbi:hypothetical protein HWV62_23663 [Athelia sp. TMB]|nr:hypothetical protein HWV62_23663 [Athelia sp. TMB]
MPSDKPHVKRRPGPDFQAAKAHAEKMKSRSMESFALERESDGKSNHYAVALAGWPKRRQQPDRDESGAEKKEKSAHGSLQAHDDRVDYVAAIGGWPKGSKLRQASAVASDLAQVMKGWPKRQAVISHGKDVQTEDDKQGEADTARMYSVITPEPGEQVFNLPRGSLGPITPEADRMGFFPMEIEEQSLLSKLAAPVPTSFLHSTSSTRPPSRQMSETGMDAETSVKAHLIQEGKGELVEPTLPDVKRDVLAGLGDAGPDLQALGPYGAPSTQSTSRPMSDGGVDGITAVKAPAKEEEKGEPIEIHDSDSESAHSLDQRPRLSVVSNAAEPGSSQRATPQAAMYPPSSSGQLSGFCRIGRDFIDSIPDWKREHAELWHTEFILARDFASGRHDKDKATAFTSIRQAMDEGIQSLGGYSAAVVQGSIGDLKEESKMKRQAVDTLREATKHIKGAEKAYSDLLMAIDRGLY